MKRVRWAHQDSLLRLRYGGRANLGPADYERCRGRCTKPPEETWSFRRSVESRRTHPGTEAGKLVVPDKPVYKRGPWDVAATSLVTRLA